MKKPLRSHDLIQVNAPKLHYSKLRSHIKNNDPKALEANRHWFERITERELKRCRQ